MKTIFVNLLAFSTLISSVFTITSKNPVISVIFLITTFVSASGYLILLGINFIGISYIIVYVGAIAVLFLFVIMLINIKLTDILETGTQYTKNLPLAIAISCLFLIILFSVIPFNFNNVPAISVILQNITSLNSIFNLDLMSTVNNLDTSFISKIFSSNIFSTQNSDLYLNDFQQIESLGYSLYTYGAVLLITLSVILLLAMLAVIVITGTKKNNTNNHNPSNTKVSPNKNLNKLNKKSVKPSSTSIFIIKLKKQFKFLDIFFNKSALKSLTLENIIKEIKIGYSLPLYPKHVENFNNHLYIKIFRFIASICLFLCIFSRTYIITNYDIFAYNIVRIIAIIFLIYRLVLLFYSIKQTIFYFRSGQLSVRNSPLNPYLTFIRAVSNSSKNAFTFTVSTGWVFGLGYELDTILEANGKNKFFLPLLGNTLTATGLDPYFQALMTKIGITDQNTNTVTDVQKIIATIQSSHEMRRAILTDMNGLSESQKEEFQKRFKTDFSNFETMQKFVFDSKNQKTILDTITKEIESKDPFNNRTDTNSSSNTDNNNEDKNNK
jgi:NADH-ubiquinone oxidoreductase chain 6